MSRAMIALCCVLAISGSAFAEGVCPPGYFPVTGNGPTGCIPFPGNGGVPPDPGPQWASRWTAIATANGVFGAAKDLSNRRKAEKQAMRDCKAKGGKDCGIVLTFANQCGALAWGDRANHGGIGGDVAAAESDALKACSTQTQNCQIYYSACSYPQKLN